MRLLRRIPLVNFDQNRVLSTTSLIPKEPKGFGNFGKKDKTEGRSESRRARRKEKEEDTKPEKSSDKGNDPNENKKPKKDPKKDSEKKKDGGGNPFDFEGDPNWVTAFYALVAGVVGSLLYEQGMIGPTQNSSQNEFLSDVNKGKVTELVVRNRELGSYYPSGSTQVKTFQIGSIDQLEDSIRRVSKTIQI